MKAVLGLEDGTVIKGTGFGAEGTACGELVFTTQFTGYEEALTDPSYKGQILMFTNPLIGNYGVSGERFQSDNIHAEGLVVREACRNPYHYKSTRSIHRFLEDEGKAGIEGVDTRALTIKTRERGTLRAALITGSDDGEEAVLSGGHEDDDDFSDDDDADEDDDFFPDDADEGFDDDEDDDLGDDDFDDL